MFEFIGNKDALRVMLMLLLLTLASSAAPILSDNQSVLVTTIRPMSR